MKEVKIPLSVGIVSYNMYCNFTNYGSALQSWALYQTVERMFDREEGPRPYLVDYCPDILADVNPLNPFARMWDKDGESRKMCELSLPAIRGNYEKFTRFYAERFRRTSRRYVSENFNSIAEEGIERFLCGSDTIFCKDEFGFDFRQILGNSNVCDMQDLLFVFHIMLNAQRKLLCSGCSF